MAASSFAQYTFVVARLKFIWFLSEFGPVLNPILGLRFVKKNIYNVLVAEDISQRPLDNNNSVSSFRFPWCSFVAHKLH